MDVGRHRSVKHWTLCVVFSSRGDGRLWPYCSFFPDFTLQYCSNVVFTSVLFDLHQSRPHVCSQCTWTFIQSILEAGIILMVNLFLFCFICDSMWMIRPHPNIKAHTPPWLHSNLSSDALTLRALRRPLTFTHIHISVDTPLCRSEGEDKRCWACVTLKQMASHLPLMAHLMMRHLKKTKDCLSVEA